MINSDVDIKFHFVIISELINIRLMAEDVLDNGTIGFLLFSTVSIGVFVVIAIVIMVLQKIHILH